MLSVITLVVNALLFGIVSDIAVFVLKRDVKPWFHVKIKLF